MNLAEAVQNSGTLTGERGQLRLDETAVIRLAAWYVAGLMLLEPGSAQVQRTQENLSISVVEREPGRVVTVRMGPPFGPGGVAIVRSDSNIEFVGLEGLGFEVNRHLELDALAESFTRLVAHGDGLIYGEQRERASMMSRLCSSLQCRAANIACLERWAEKF